MIVLVDIDGTIADCSHRLHFIHKSDDPPSDWKPDWDGFFNAMGDDKQIPQMVRFIRVLSHSNECEIVYITGRPDSHRKITLKWLKDNNLPLGSLVMRKVGDHRPDFKVKAELYEYYIKPFVGHADLAIEDRAQVVKMWRDMGLTCLQPKDGDY